MSFFSKIEDWLNRFFTEEYTEDEYNPEEMSGGGRPRDSHYGAGALPARAVRPMDAVIMAPRSYSDAKRAADAMENGKVVLVILEDSIEDSEAARFVDFMSGAVYLAKGEVELLEGRVLICLPSTVHLELDHLPRLEGIPVWKGPSV